VMEHFESIDLATLVKRDGPLTVDKAVDYVVQAARGLERMHAERIYHRNIKPANLLLGGDGTVKVANMILARAEDAEQQDSAWGGTLTMKGQMMGTVDYMAPEQAVDAHSVDQRADIYSLGCSLYFLVTGQPPYQEQTLLKKIGAHRFHPIPSLRGVLPDVDPAIDAVFQKMLAKAPADRYQSVSDVIGGLTGQSKNISKGMTFGAPSASSGSRVVGLAVGAAVLIVAVIALVLWRIFTS
jgi:eukaryotic-like serine/threonine-protein kinase